MQESLKIKREQKFKVMQGEHCQDMKFCYTSVFSDCVEKIVEARKEEGLGRYIRMRFRIEGS